MSSSKPETKPSLLSLRLGLGLTVVLGAAALYQFFQRFADSGQLWKSTRLQAAAAAGILGLLLLAGIFILAWTSIGKRLARYWEAGLPLPGILGLALFALGIALFTWVVLGPYGRYFGNYTVRLFLFWLLTLGGGLCLAAGFPSFREYNWLERLGLAILVGAVGFRLAAFTQDISTYPFSLNWSETSRYYYASLYVARTLYGMDVPPTVLHPSRYLLQALPFLLPQAPLWLHRLWQVLLWVGMTAITTFLFVKRLRLPANAWRWALAGWAFLFLLVGPVYYHLQVTLILVLWGYDRRRFWRTLGVVLLASAWAGISRINWFPMPGLLAAALYFLEQPVEKQGKPGEQANSVSNKVLGYLLPPAIWVVAGTLLALGSQALYMTWSGNPAEQFSSSFTSDLLWYRLLPSATFPLGVLPGALLFLLPMLVLLAASWRRGPGYHWLRLLGLGAMLFVLFAGGIVVSVKIGGGSNLHNLDAFLSLFLVVGASIYFGRMAPDHAASAPAPRTNRLLLGVVLLVPVLFTIESGSALRLAGAKTTRQALETISAAIEQSQGPVLYLAERQLFMFGYVPETTLEPDYEKVFLMEMAMANNTAYLDEFHTHLRNHDYGLIISEPLKVVYQGSANSFGEENDAWVERVAKPVLCYYEAVDTLKVVRVELLVPRVPAPGGLSLNSIEESCCMYWSRTGNSLDFILFVFQCLLWWSGGWLLVTHAFSLGRRERLVTGLAAGLLLFITLSNLLAPFLPLTAAFWTAAVLVLLGGLVAAWHGSRQGHPWVEWSDWRTWEQPITLLVLTLFLTFIGRGLAVFDEYLHIPLVSTMAAGDIPPHFYLDPARKLAYHYGLQVFAAAMVRVGGLFVWSAWDISKALAIALTGMLSWVWLRRLTRSMLGAYLGSASVLLAGGGRWLLLLLPPSLLLRISAGVQLINTGKDSGPDLFTVLGLPWHIEGGGTFPFPFAYHNGIFVPVIFTLGASGALPFVTVLALLLLARRARYLPLAVPVLGMILASLALSGEHLFAFLGVGIVLGGLVYLWPKPSKSAGVRWRLPQVRSTAFTWLAVLAIAGLLAAVQGGFLTEALRGILQRLQGTYTQVGEYNYFTFGLRWPPGLDTGHLAELKVTDWRSLLVLLAELGPALLLLPWAIGFAWRGRRQSDLLRLGLGLAALLSLLVPLFLRYGVERSSTRLPATAMWLFVLLGFPLAWHSFARAKELPRALFGLGSLALAWGGLVLLAIQITAMPYGQLTYFINGYDAQISQQLWDKLPRDAQVFDHVPYRSVAIFGRAARATRISTTPGPNGIRWKTTPTRPPSAGVVSTTCM